MILNLRKEDFFKPVDSPIAMARRLPQWPFEIHSHEFCEIVFILGGHGLHITENEAYPVEAGDVFVITGSRSHGYKELDNLNLINIYYDPKDIHMPIHDLFTLAGYQALFTLEPAYRRQHRFESRLRLSADELAYVNKLIDVLDDELRNERKGYRFMVCAVFMQIIGYLSRCYERSPNIASQSLLRIGEAISYMETHYDCPITLGELAELACMSKRNFSRVFRKTMGYTPINYLTHLRLAKAADLLPQRQMNITQIAFHVGFQDSNYFTRQFHNIFGVSPRHYRNEKLL